MRPFAFEKIKSNCFCCFNYSFFRILAGGCGFVNGKLDSLKTCGRQAQFSKRMPVVKPAVGHKGRGACDKLIGNWSQVKWQSHIFSWHALVARQHSEEIQLPKFWNLCF